MELTWVEGRTMARSCPLCGNRGPHLVVVHYRAPYGDNPPRDLLRCDECRSMFLDDLSDPPHIEDSPAVRDHINFYVELSAGIDVMAELLYKVDTTGVRQYLEIGCGFGFALDFARHAFGWQVAGVDPGIIARTGKRALDLDIAADYLTPGYDFGSRRFDLMMCSEVVEHVPAPGPFLGTLKHGLTDEGVLVLTTPSADRVRRDTPPSILLPILQPGFHLVLFTRESLEHALRTAGFSHVEVWEEGATLVAVAGMRPVAVNRLARVDPGHYRSYLERGVKDRAPSPLAVGMAYRLLKHVTNAGDLAAAEDVFARARALITKVYRIDIGRPEALGLEALPPLTFLEVGAHMPFCLGCVLYYRGMALLIRARYPEAVRFFRASVAAALSVRRALRTLAFDDGDSEAAAQLSRVHLPMALAHVDSDQALHALADLSVPPPPGVPADLWSLPDALISRARQETFTRLVSLGSYGAAETILAAVRHDVGLETQACDDPKVLAAQPGYTLSALYCLAVLTRNHMLDPGAAAPLFAAVRAACQARLIDMPTDAQARDLVGQALANETQCRAAAAQDAAEKSWRPQPLPVPSPSESPGARAGDGLASAADGPTGVARSMPRLLLGDAMKISIDAAAPDFSGFVVRFGTLGKVNSCGLELEVVGGEPTREVARGVFPTETLFDNGQVLFQFRSAGRLEPGTYVVQLRSPNARAGNCLAVYPDVVDIRYGPVHEAGGEPMLLLNGQLAARPLGDGLSPSRVQLTVLRHWVDGWGMFVEGHLMWDGNRPDALTVGTAHGSMTDLVLSPVDERTLRFRGYVDRPASVPVIARVATGGKEDVLPLILPPLSPLPDVQDPGLFARFVASINESGGTVVEIGSNLGHPTSQSQRGFFASTVRYLGVDIHADRNTDLVVDAHRLGSVIEPGSVHGVFSLSVLEHLAAPWIVAIEINRVLAPGGLVYHQTHQTWPTHAYPNDFWRFSDEALKHLFGPAFGFEVIAAAMGHPIICHPARRTPEYLNMPFLPGHGGAYVLARKVRDVTAVPTSAEMAQLSGRYPQLAPGTATV